MTRRYRAQSSAERYARAERRSATLPPVEPRDDLREPGYIRIALGHVVIAWTLRPHPRNVRKWGAYHESDDSQVLIDGRHLIGGKDEIGRAALKLLPRFMGLRNFT